MTPRRILPGVRSASGFLRGLTLIELLLVLAIILILIAVALPNFLEARIDGRILFGVFFSAGPDKIAGNWAFNAPVRMSMSTETVVVKASRTRQRTAPKGGASFGESSEIGTI